MPDDEIRESDEEQDDETETGWSFFEDDLLEDPLVDDLPDTDDSGPGGLRRLNRRGLLEGTESFQAR
jgi:hypothetical protein